MTLSRTSPIPTPLSWPDLQDPFWGDELSSDQPDLFLEEAELVSPEKTAPRPEASTPTEDPFPRTTLPDAQGPLTPQDQFWEDLPSLPLEQRSGELGLLLPESTNLVDQVAKDCFQAAAPLLTLNQPLVGEKMFQPNQPISDGIVYTCEKDSDKAVIQAGGLENHTVLYCLGMQYLCGIDCEKNQNLALAAFAAGADLGDPACSNLLKWCYEQGIGAPPLPQMPTESTLNHSVVPAYTGLSALHLLGAHNQLISGAVASLPQKVIHPSLPTPTENGSPEIQLLFPKMPPQQVSLQVSEELKIVLEEIAKQKNLSQYVTALVEKAKEGKDWAINDLGVCYYEGKEVEQNFEYAFTLFDTAAKFDSAAKRGNPFALCNLAYCYKYGKGCSVDLQAASYRFHKLAEQGFPFGYNGLGLCYLFGVRTENLSASRSRSKFCKKAAQCFREGAEKGGDWACMLNLASCYAFGIGVERDLAVAQKKMTDAHNLKDNPDAHHLIKDAFYLFTEDDIRRLLTKKPDDSLSRIAPAPSKETALTKVISSRIESRSSLPESSSITETVLAESCVRGVDQEIEKIPSREDLSHKIELLEEKSPVVLNEEALEGLAGRSYQGLHISKRVAGPISALQTTTPPTIVLPAKTTLVPSYTGVSALNVIEDEPPAKRRCFDANH